MVSLKFKIACDLVLKCFCFLKDGANGDIQRSLDKTMELECKEDGIQQSKTVSPFNDLYQMIKKSLDVKTPRKSSVSLLQTPTSRFCTPKPSSVKKNDGKPVIPTEDKSKDSAGADETKGEVSAVSNGTPKSVKKQRRSSQGPSEIAGPAAEKAQQPATPEATPQKRNRASPQRFTAGQVIEQVCTQTLKSPTRRRSKEATPTKASVTKEQEEQAIVSPKTKASPRSSGKAEKGKKHC